MKKLSYIFSFLRFEEYLAIFVSLIFFSLFFLKFPIQFFWRDLFSNVPRYANNGIAFFQLFFLVFIIYFSFKTVISIGHIFAHFIVYPKESLGKFYINFALIKKSLKNSILFFLSIIRVSLVIILPFSSISLLLSGMLRNIREPLWNITFIEFDKLLIGYYPFSFFTKTSFLNDLFLSQVFLKSFLFLSVFMGISGLIFYIYKRGLFSQYIAAICLTMLFSLPFWYFLPALSPQNAFIYNIFQKPLPESISLSLNNYQPNEILHDFQSKVNESQKDTGSISTMPSMHIAWAFLTVFYLALFSRISLFLTLPWFFLSSFGTVYLAQHYILDGLLAIPIAMLSIVIVLVLSNFSQSQEKLSPFDFGEIIRRDLSWGFNLAKNFFEYFGKWGRSLRG